MTPEALRAELARLRLTNFEFASLFRVVPGNVHAWISGQRPVPKWVEPALVLFDLLTPQARQTALDLLVAEKVGDKSPAARPRSVDLTPEPPPVVYRPEPTPEPPAVVLRPELTPEPPRVRPVAEPVPSPAPARVETAPVAEPATSTSPAGRNIHPFAKLEDL